MHIAVIEGDARSARLCELLNERGFDAKLFSSETDAAAFGDVLLPPMKRGVSIGVPLRKGQELVAFEDFCSREDFSILNAIATAEGAIELAMRETPVTLHGSEALVIGYGRIGKILSERLLALGALVTAGARKETDFAWITARSLTAAHTGMLKGSLYRYDVIFNTVPKMVLPEPLLNEIKPACVIIDLASPPGGVDFSAAEKLGLRCHWALALPGQCAPESAAQVTALVLTRILEERGVL
ncbi:MAG: hypothetical protein LBR72_08225 [Oscillospiraceae bacterium]|jgi:dipicolinate synthase subunit A|nr:hypothetical protein [Oscillospiraceae bacterium]